jgi:voltage-gated potassium channel
MLGYVKNYNFFILLAGLVGFLLLTPVLQVYAHDSVRLLILWGLCLTLLIQVWSLIENVVLFRFGMMLTILSFFLTGFGELYPEIVFIKLMSTVTFLIFFGLALVIAAKEVFSRASISANTFAGAFSLYLLLGMIWTLLYILAYQLEPGAFKGVDPYVASGELIYFSYITLTSLGYGDIVALTPVTRTLAFIEVIVGQFYMAVLVGALVGKYITHHNE